MRITFPGGINENDSLSIYEASEGKNFDLVAGDSDYRPRPPFDLKGTSTLGGSISGIMQLIKRDNTETTLIFDDDGSTPTIYLWDGSTTFTSKRTLNLATGSLLRDTYWSLDNQIVISDIAKLTPMLKWDGSTCTRLKTELVNGSATANTSITESSGTFTVAKTSHGYSSGDLVTIADADTGFNGEFEVTVTGPNEFTYTGGTGTGAASAPGTSDKGTELYAKYSIVHNGRLWLFNITTDDGTSTENPHMILASEYENHESYNTAKRAVEDTFSTGNEAFYMLSRDLKPINGAFEFQSELIISTEGGQLFKLVGLDAEDYQFIEFYVGSAAIGTESFANIGNDCVYMRGGGNIESLRSTQQFGDVQADDISRWIPDTVKDITGAKVIYDQSNQKVFFFVGSKILVLYKHLMYTDASPWSIFTTNLMAGDANALAVINSARYMKRPGEQTRTVYFGAADGKIYDLNGVGNGDAGSVDIETYRKTKIIDIQDGEIDPMNDILLGRVQYRRIGECELSLEFDWSDAYNVSTADITLNGPPFSDTAPYYNGSAYYGGTDYYNKGFQFSNKVSTKGFSPTGRGISFIMNAYLSTSVNFKIDHIDI